MSRIRRNRKLYIGILFSAVERACGGRRNRPRDRAHWIENKKPWRASVVQGTSSTAICSGLPLPCSPAHLLSHGH